MSGEEDPAPRARVGPGAIVAGAFLLAAGGYGALIGRSVAEAQAVGEMTAVFGALSGMVTVAGSVIVLIVIGLIAAVRGHGATSVPGTIFGMAGAVVLGAILGQATWTATKGVDEPNVVHEARGTANLELQPTQVAFVARSDASIRCVSVLDGEDVAEVSSLDLGELGPATLKGYLSWGDNRSFARLALFLDLDDLPPGSMGTFWEGTVDVGEFGSAVSGTASFTARQSGDPASSSWPRSLEGVVGWACDGWDVQASPTD